MSIDKFTGLVIILLVLPLCAGTFASDAITMSAIDSPPYYTANAGPGERRGVAIEITDQAWKKVNVNVSFNFIPMVRAVWSVVEQSHTPLLGTPQWFTKEKKEDLIEAVDLLIIRFVFFYKKDRFPDGLTYASLQDLKDYTIGNVRGSSTLPLLKQAGLNLILVSEVAQNFKKLNADRVDLVVGVDLSGWAILQELYPDDIDQFAIVEKPFFTADISAIFMKEQANRIQQFKAGLDQIIKDGTYQRILEKYYGKNVAPIHIVPPGIQTKLNWQQ